MATVTKPLALNESLNTTEQTPRNVADVLLEGLANVVEAIGNGGGIGMCNSTDPFSFAYVITTNAGFKVETGRYLSIVFSVNNFWYDGVHPLRLSVNNQLYEVKINGESPVTGKTYVKVDDAGIFVYDGTYFQLIRTSGGGHVIQNQSGNAMAQEDAMQFLDAHLTDDSTNGRTVVENVKEVTLAELSQATERGMYLATDEESVPIGEIEEDVVSVTADGVKTIGDLLNELATDVDWDNVTDGAYISETLGTTTIVYTHYRHTVSSATFYYGGSASGGARVGSYTVRANNSSAEVSTGTSYSDVTATQKPTQGTVITLHYGTSSTVVNLKTSADYCQYDENTTVKQAIDKLKEIKKTTVTGATNSAGVLTSSLGSNKVVLSATRHDQSSEYNVIQPYYHTVDNIWYFKIMNVAGNITANNPGVSVDVYYIEI